MMVMRENREGLPVFPLHYGSEAETYVFYKIPKILFKADLFKSLSTDARLLYGMLLDRLQLSIKNGWIDEEGRVFIYYPRQEIMIDLNCGNKKAGQLFAELDDKNGIGLITRVHQGLGRPDRIYVRKCALPNIPIRGSPASEKNAGNDTEDTGDIEAVKKGSDVCKTVQEGGEKRKSGSFETGCNTAAFQEVSKGHARRCQNDTSGGVEKAGPEVLKTPCNKTDKNKTDRSKTDLIRSYPQRASGAEYTDKIAILEEYRLYRDHFEQACCMSYLRKENPFRIEAIDEIRELLTETCCSRKPMIRVGGEDKPAEIVRSRLMKLDSGHIQYVLNCLAHNTTRVRNIRQYLLTSLFNAPATIDNYYKAEANFDMYGKEVNGNDDSTDSRGNPHQF